VAVFNVPVPVSFQQVIATRSEGALVIFGAHMQNMEHQSKIRQIIYTSRGVPNFQVSEILSILAQSVRNNQRDDITGFLIFKHGHFRQLIEGASDVIEELYKRIDSDTRHTILTKDMDRMTTRRTFPMWAMALAEGEGGDALVGSTSHDPKLKGYMHVLDTSVDPSDEGLDGVVRLLGTFNP
jgi:hypothetical protein